MSFTPEEEKVLKDLAARLQGCPEAEAAVRKKTSINVRVTQKMAEALKSEATSRNITVSDLIRGLLEMRLDYDRVGLN